MRRFALVPLLFVVAACPGDKKGQPDTSVAIDTTPINLDSITSAIPEPEPDTFVKTIPKVPVVRRPSIPPAPPALMEAVEREQAFSKFCYQEFGQKNDPTLAGGVAVVVTVGAGGITATRVADDSWSSRSGKAVNECLLDKAKTAWRLPPRAVKPGQYVVQLAFRPS